MGIEERSIDRALARVVDEQQNDTPFLGPIDTLRVALWENSSPRGEQRTYELMEKVAAAIGRTGIQAEIYRLVYGAGNSQTEAGSGIRIHVTNRDDMEPETLYKSIPAPYRKMTYARTPSSEETV